MANFGSSTRKPFPRQSGLARNPAAHPSYHSATGWYDSLKMQVSIPFESLLELDLFLGLDLDPDVLAFSAQPETFQWTDLYGRRRYTPDARATLKSGIVLFVQAKSRAKLAKNPDLDGRLVEIESQCRMRQASHVIWTEDEIRRTPRISNVRRLRASVAFLNDQDRKFIIDACSALGLPTPLGAILDFLGPQKTQLNAVLALVALGYLRIDLDASIDSEIVIHAGERICPRRP